VKFKLDENIGRRGLEFLRASGHDVMTVRDQGLGGARDDRLFAAYAKEGRTLVTLDHDFGQVPRFPPEQSAGLIILEVGRRATAQAILDRMKDFLAVMMTHSVVGALWIVEPGRVRIHLRHREE
jgi:predicted nuclease of predicted toxin-antitoxin system